MYISIHIISCGTYHMIIEQRIKQQFSKHFKRSDKIPYRQTADYYFMIAATIKNKDIKTRKGLQLWIRNVQKRLYLGIGTELLLKAIYLSKGFNINKSKRNVQINFPEKISNLKVSQLKKDDTYSLNQLIDKLHLITGNANDYDRILEALKICKVFRNKEGHVAVHRHKFEQKDYREIEYAIVRLYEIGFSENLTFEISISDDDGIGKFEIN
jgi:hypothetical protein